MATFPLIGSCFEKTFVLQLLRCDDKEIWTAPGLCHSIQPSSYCFHDEGQKDEIKALPKSCKEGGNRRKLSVTTEKQEHQPSFMKQIEGPLALIATFTESSSFNYNHNQVAFLPFSQQGITRVKNNRLILKPCNCNFLLKCQFNDYRQEVEFDQRRERGKKDIFLSPQASQKRRERSLLTKKLDLVYSRTHLGTKV